LDRAGKEDFSVFWCWPWHSLNLLHFERPLQKYVRLFRSLSTLKTLGAEPIWSHGTDHMHFGLLRAILQNYLVI